MIPEIEQKIIKSGFKITSQRRAILKAISDNLDKHLCPDEIYSIVKENNPDIGLATIYRSLQSFTRIGVLTKMNLDDNISRYELVLQNSKHTHHHLICDTCNKVDEISEDLLDDVELNIDKDYGFSVRNHIVKFYGTCKKCQAS